MFYKFKVFVIFLFLSFKKFTIYRQSIKYALISHKVNLKWD